MLKHETLSFNI